MEQRTIRGLYYWDDNDTLMIILGGTLEDRPSETDKSVTTLVLQAECTGKPFHKVQNGLHSLATAKILHALASGTLLECHDLPLGDVVNYFQDFHGIGIALDEKASARTGVNLDAPITMTLKGATLDAGLTMILTPLGMTYKIENEKIVVTANR